MGWLQRPGRLARLEGDRSECTACPTGWEALDLLPGGSVGQAEILAILTIKLPGDALETGVPRFLGQKLPLVHFPEFSCITPKRGRGMQSRGRWFKLSPGNLFS